MAIEFKELAEVGRSSSPTNTNGHHPDPEPTWRAIGGAPTKREAGFEQGRQVDPNQGQFYRLDLERRQYGRDEGTINALRAIRDWDPQASHATFNFQRLINPGHDLIALVGKGTDESRQETPAQAFLDEIAQRCGAEWGGGLDQFHNVLSLQTITYGAVCAEVAPTEDLRGVEDWYAIKPLLMAFKRVKTSPEQSVGTLTLGQRFKGGQWAPVNPNQVFYQPLDPDDDDPYGRPPLMAALQTVLSKSQMLNDLRAVAHNQGYPRIDVKIVWKTLMDAAPPTLRDAGKVKELTDWANKQLDNVISDYVKLNVDDTYVHYDWVEVGMVGPNYAASSFDFKGLEAILSRQINNSLKTLPILLGYNEATSETHGSIQWQIQVAGILTLQRLVKRVIEKLANASLRLGGFDARAKIIYKAIRSVDRKYEAESAFLEGKSQQLYVQMGWADNDEASTVVLGHKAKGQPTAGAMGITPTSGQLGNQGNSDNQTQNGTGSNTASTFGSLIDGLLGSEREAHEDEFRRQMLRTLRRAPVEIDDRVIAYGSAGAVIFMRAKADLIEVLRAEGLLDEERDARTIDSDIADHVFGVGFSREMKALLRKAMREGMTMAGVETPVIDERLVERIWRENRQYVRHLREDLKASLMAGELKTLVDVDNWFKRNAWRENLMGIYLGRQALNGGFAYAVTLDNSVARFVWNLGAAEKHCTTCLERESQTYTYLELLSIGFPGSTSLQCGAGCKCSLTEEGGD